MFDHLPAGDTSRRTCRFGRDGITTSTPALLGPATAPLSPVKSTTASAAFFDVLDLFSVWPVRLSPSQKHPLWSRVHFRHFGSSLSYPQSGWLFMPLHRSHYEAITSVFKSKGRTRDLPCPSPLEACTSCRPTSFSLEPLAPADLTASTSSLSPTASSS